jgi:ribosome-binding ATPase YchF (GTP1/OBG family)
MEELRMAKTASLEADLERLKKKVREQKAAEHDAGDPKLRALRKRLKRAQRKRRRLALRKEHAKGKKTGQPQAAAT